MKGVILAGGLGTRLGTLTQITNKHLLPVWDKPMIYYPIKTLISAGVKEILIISSGPFAGDFFPLLKNGKEFKLKNIQYAYQSKPDGGIADALALAENFTNGKNFAVILGDNTMDSNVSFQFKKFKSGAHIFLKKVKNPKDFGVVKFEKGKKYYSENETDREIIEIIEKPESPPSNYAVTGLYLFDNKVFDFIKKCEPSARNQLEITTVLDFYLKDKNLKFSYLNGFWHDCGTPDSLFESSQYYYNKSILKKMMINDKFTNEAIDFILGWKNIPVKRIGNYLNIKTKISWQCKIDGNIWEERPNNILNTIENSYYGCRKCSENNKIIITNALIDSAIKDRNIIRLEDCNSVNSRINFKCNIHNKIWKTKAVYVIDGSGCPSCLWKNQIKIENFLREAYFKNYEIEPQFRIIESKILKVSKRGFITDFCIINKDTKEIYFIEYNGQQHYEPTIFGNMSKEVSVSNFERQKKRDSWVRDFCKNKNITLIELPYFESIEENKKRILNIVKI